MSKSELKGKLYFDKERMSFSAAILRKKTKVLRTFFKKISIQKVTHL